MEQVIDQQNFEQLINGLKESEDWMVLRIAKDGFHMNIKRQDSLALMAFLLANDQDLWDMVKTTVWEFKKKNNK